MEINKIYCGDCLPILKTFDDCSVDAVITDPPYSSGGATMAERQKDPVKKYEQSGNKIIHRPTFWGDTKDQRSWMHWCNLWISECQRILKPNGYFLMFTDWRQLPAATDVLQIGELIWRGIISWDKGNSARAPHKGYFRHQCEYIVWGTKGKCPHAQHAGPYYKTLVCFARKACETKNHLLCGWRVNGLYKNAPIRFRMKVSKPT